MTSQKSIAVVTGATGGIGAAIVRALADDHVVWLVGRDCAALRRLAASVPAARCWPMDLGSNGAVTVPPDLSRVDALVHTAGVFAAGSIAQTSDRTWQTVFEANLFGAVRLTRGLLPALRSATGRVVFINSTAVRASGAERASYTASKAALRAFADALHQEELDHGIRVTSIYAGRVATNMQRQVRCFEGGEFEPERYLSPASVASTVSWLVHAPSDAHLTEFTIKATRVPPSPDPARPVPR